METPGMASACSSFWEEEGAGTGVTGAAGASGLAQHAGVWQSLQSLQHEPASRVWVVAGRGDAAMAEPASRINPSSNAIAILRGFCAMPVLRSFKIRQPCKTIAYRQADAKS
jgi:hypothetical protein